MDSPDCLVKGHEGSGPFSILAFATFLIKDVYMGQIEI